MPLLSSAPVSPPLSLLVTPPSTSLSALLQVPGAQINCIIGSQGPKNLADEHHLIVMYICESFSYSRTLLWHSRIACDCWFMIPDENTLVSYTLYSGCNSIPFFLPFLLFALTAKVSLEISCPSLGGSHMLTGNSIGPVRFPADKVGNPDLVYSTAQLFQIAVIA